MYKALRRRHFRLPYLCLLHMICKFEVIRLDFKTLVFQISAITNNSMNKADLVNLVAARTELTKTDVSLVVDAAIETIVDSVVEGKKVSILGFGSFEPRDRSARQGLNPKTGEKIAIPAKRVPTFSAGKLFKDRVQG